MTTNNALQQAGNHRGRPVLATDCALARAETHSAPTEILKRYEKWKDIASMSGPMGLRLIKGFHDEAYAGEWKHS